MMGAENLEFEFRVRVITHIVHWIFCEFLLYS